MVHFSAIFHSQILILVALNVVCNVAAFGLGLLARVLPDIQVGTGVLWYLALLLGSQITDEIFGGSDLDDESVNSD